MALWVVGCGFAFGVFWGFFFFSWKEVLGMFPVLLEKLLICLCCLSSVSVGGFLGMPLLYLLLHSCISCRLEAGFWYAGLMLSLHYMFCFCTLFRGHFPMKCPQAQCLQPKPPGFALPYLPAMWWLLCQHRHSWKLQRISEGEFPSLQSSDSNQLFSGDWESWGAR